MSVVCACADPECAVYGCHRLRGLQSTAPQWTAPPVAPVGWRCPNCGAGVAPFMPMCLHCAPAKAPAGGSDV